MLVAAFESGPKLFGDKGSRPTVDIEHRRHEFARQLVHLEQHAALEVLGAPALANVPANREAIGDRALFGVCRTLSAPS